MPELIIQAVRIIFPFDPYPEQINYMDSLLKTLHSNSNAALEAQTGFGKSVCIFASTYAFQQQFSDARVLLEALYMMQQSPNFGSKPHDIHIRIISEQHNLKVKDLNLSYEFILLNKLFKQCIKDNKIFKTIDQQAPQIVFLSRTHTQLKQANKALKQLNLDVKASYLGARHHFCLNDQAKNISLKEKIPLQTVCKSLVKNRKCSFSVDQKIESNDMEDIFSSGLANQTCPYFSSRHSLDSNFIIGPYNIIFDKEVVKNIQNSIIIFDEGHNFESFVKGQFQVQFDVKTLSLSLSNIQLALQVCKELNISQGSLAQLVNKTKLSDSQAYYQNHENHLQKLGEILLKIKLNIQALASLESLYFDNIFDGVNLKQLTPELIESANYADFVIYNLRHDYKKNNSKAPYLYNQKIDKDYKFGIVLETSKIVEIAMNSVIAGAKSDDIGVIFVKEKFNIFCLNTSIPAKIVQKINPYSIILTSATLSPMVNLEIETGLNYLIKKSFKSVMSDNQLICKNIDDKRLVGTFQNRNNEYFQQVASIILDAQFNTKHGGTLVFVQSYQIIKELKSRIQGQQYVFFEGDDEALDKYQQSIQFRPILVAVARGSLSEGIDFADELCRTVIIVSIPFPDIKDQILIKQRQWLDKYGKGLNGNVYYENLAFRAVNQCIGRVIRHKDDFGTVILADQRYCERRNIQNLPKWVVQNIQTCSIDDLGKFNIQKSKIVKTEDSDVLDVPVTISQQNFHLDQDQNIKHINLYNIQQLSQNKDLQANFLLVIKKLKNIQKYEQLKIVQKEAKISIVQAAITLSDLIKDTAQELSINEFEIILANVNEELLQEVLCRL